MRMVKWSVLLTSVLALFGLLGAASASAGSPWWHLLSGVRPGYLHAGVAKDEVQELKVGATGGTLILEDAETGNYEVFTWDRDG